MRPTYLDHPLPIGFAHRGGAAAGDENTTAAFERAVAMGYRYIETDTHATSDGVAVAFHDPTLDRVLDRPGQVGALRYADLATLRIGGAAAIPRLADILGAWPDIRFNIDTKADPAVVPALQAIRGAGATDRVLIASFSDRRLAWVRRLAPEVVTSAGTREAASLWVRAASAGVGRRSRRARPLPAGMVAVQVPPRYGRITVVTPGFVRYMHQVGLQVHVWTIDEPAQMRYFLDMGVDGIMTDRIEVLRDVFAERGHWPS